MAGFTMTGIPTPWRVAGAPLLTEQSGADVGETEGNRHETRDP